MKAKRIISVFLAVFLLTSVLPDRKAHALVSLIDLGSFEAAIQAGLRQLDQFERLLLPFPPENHAAQYSAAPAQEEDRRLTDACFKGVAVQNTGADNELKEQSTLSQEINVIAGVQPTECMPNKTTRRFSPLELNPWYYTSIISTEGIREYYQGEGYRGDRNPIKNANRMVACTETSVTSCSSEPMVANLAGNSNLDNPVWMRRELDNTLNQYILQHARFIRMPDEEANERFSVNSGLCQPLDLTNPPTNHELFEYTATQYINWAWKKLLWSENFQARNGRSRAEPHYARDSRVRITRAIPAPDDTFGLITVEDLAEESGEVDLQFEKIVDPSHPFSPRWDFEVTDRSYSSNAAAYRANPRDAVRCAEVPVDLLSFRKHHFDKWVPQKISANTQMYNYFQLCLRTNGFGSPQGTSFCYSSPTVLWGFYRCNPGAPCCSTRWDQKDKIRDQFLATTLCGRTMQELCDEVSRPLVGINTLKMREINDENFPDGVPEGYSFRDYFGDHKPYMRCWDTGTECGEEDQTFPKTIEGGSHTFIYNPDETTGADYAIVGAGREGESCLIGGGLGMDGVANPDPITSWSELKLYQVRAMRMGAKCIAVHEKLFKPYTAEELILKSTGINVPIVLPKQPGSCLLDPTDDTVCIGSRSRTMQWPRGWRGYVSDPNPDTRFPNFGGETAQIDTGLDNAIKGEILIFDQDVVMGGGAGTWRNPYIGLVKDVVNERSRSGGGYSDVHDPAQDYVDIIAYNHGKYVDACGNTDEMGMGSDLKLVKTPGLFPPYSTRVFQGLDNVTPDFSCDDPSMVACYEQYWNSVKRYNIKEDVRDGS